MIFSLFGVSRSGHVEGSKSFFLRNESIRFPCGREKGFTTEGRFISECRVGSSQFTRFGPGLGCGASFASGQIYDEGQFIGKRANLGLVLT